ncbi:hypothetical protein BHM03_00047210 [Ensete ventricosum]|nr:hypothetical protein BHM03_00047210 [Ensete ventricosum]
MRATRFCAPSRIRSRASETLSYGSIQRTMSAHLERGTNTGSSSTASDNSRLLSEQRARPQAKNRKVEEDTDGRECAMGTETTVAGQGNTCYRRSIALLQEEQKNSTREQPKMGRRNLQALVDDITWQMSLPKCHTNEA